MILRLVGKVRKFFKKKHLILTETETETEIENLKFEEIHNKFKANNVALHYFSHFVGQFGGKWLSREKAGEIK